MSVNYIVKTASDEMRYFNHAQVSKKSGVLICINEYRGMEIEEPSHEGKFHMSPSYWNEVIEVSEEKYWNQMKEVVE